MPKHGQMAHISRPFQIALLAVVLLAGVWLFALRSTPSTSSSSAGTPSSASPQASGSPAPAAGSSAQANAPGSIYHGAAPGVTGLTRALAKAHEAVATSQQNARQLEQKSAQASSSTPVPSSTGAASAATTGAGATAHATPATHPTVAKPTAAKPTAAKPTVAKPVVAAPVRPAPLTRTAIKPHTAVKPAATHETGTLPRQALLESRLGAGNVVLLLFWDRKGADDVAVQRAVQSVAHSQHKVFVQEAQSNEVAAFGTITRGVQVYGTPTLLIVGKNGQTIVLTGLTDPYSISQAVSEARGS
jgi:hypothetical protein